MPSAPPKARSVKASANPSAPVPKKQYKAHRAHIAHKTPGRVRMKIPTAQNNQEIFAVYQAGFSAIPSINKVSINHETGSIVIHYDPKREAEFQSHFETSCEAHNIALSSAPKPKDEIDELPTKSKLKLNFWPNIPMQCALLSMASRL